MTLKIYKIVPKLRRSSPKLHWPEPPQSSPSIRCNGRAQRAWERPLLAMSNLPRKLPLQLQQQLRHALPRLPQPLPTARVSNMPALKRHIMSGMINKIRIRLLPRRLLQLMPLQQRLRLRARLDGDANTQQLRLMELRSQDQNARKTKPTHCAAVQPTSTWEMEPDWP